MTKYTLKINDIDRPGNIEKLQRDGFTREMISKAMYRETAGASVAERRKIMSSLFERDKRR